MVGGENAIQETQTRPEAFFSEVCEAFRRAYDAAKQRPERHIRIAGRTFRLLFAGPAMQKVVMPALSHLETSGAPPPDMTVLIWDYASTGIGMPQRPWGKDDCLPYGLVRGYNTERIRTAYQADFNGLSMMDTHRNTASFWMLSAEKGNCRIYGSPLRNIIHWGSRRWGLQMVHAAGVGAERAAAIVVGRGGSGKSTTALACLGSILKYLGDDDILVEAGPVARVFSVYRVGKLTRRHLDFFPYLKPRMANWDTGDMDAKTMFFASDAEMGAPSGGLELKAIVAPKISPGRSCSLEEISPGEALRALAPSTLIQLPGGEGEDLGRLAEIARRVPAFRLSLGERIADIPGLIADLLRAGETGSRLGAVR